MFENPNHIRRVLIAGGGSAGWMTAAALSSTLENKLDIILVESEAIGTVGVGEATIPPIRTFNSTLGIDEKDFIRQTQATFKLGIEFVDWGVPGNQYFHPFGPHGSSFDISNVHQHWLKAKRSGDLSSFQDHSMAWNLARDKKFAPPSQDSRNVMSTFDYAFHFDAGLYANFLRAHSEAKGVTRIEGKISNVNVHPDTGFVTGLTLEDGQSYEADLFIDCTGFRALLMEQALGIAYEDWRHWLPCDRALAVGSARLQPLPPYTRSTAKSAGWQWRIPLQHRTGNGYVYCSQYISDSDATEELLAGVETDLVGEPRGLGFTTGRRKTLREKNVIAIGLSSGFMEPLESTSIHLIQAGISKLLALFPDRTFDPLLIAEYNRIAILEFERIRDFLILHYKLTQHNDTPFWRYCAEMDIPDSLNEKIEHFRRYGRHIAKDMDLFAMDSWLAVHIGQNNMPNMLDPITDLRESDGSEWLAKLRRAMDAAASQQQTHDAFIEKFCKAPALNA